MSVCVREAHKHTSVSGLKVINIRIEYKLDNLPKPPLKCVSNGHPVQQITTDKFPMKPSTYTTTCGSAAVYNKKKIDILDQS